MYSYFLILKKKVFKKIWFKRNNKHDQSKSMASHRALPRALYIPWRDTLCAKHFFPDLSSVCCQQTMFMPFVHVGSKRAVIIIAFCRERHNNICIFACKIIKFGKSAFGFLNFHVDTLSALVALGVKWSQPFPSFLVQQACTWLSPCDRNT